jgi:hypothetical protein
MRVKSSLLSSSPKDTRMHSAHAQCTQEPMITFHIKKSIHIHGIECSSDMGLVWMVMVMWGWRGLMRMVIVLVGGI